MIHASYRPGRSPLHRLPADAKLLLLVIAGTGAIWIAEPAWLAVLFAAACLLFPIGGFGPRQIWFQARPLLPILAALALAQGLIVGWETALAATLRFAALALLASLLTLTTAPSALTATLIRALTPLRPLGVDPARVGLAVSLAIRFLPVVGAIAEEVREAQRARGSERSILRLAIPLIVRILRSADEIAEAIDARS